MFLDCRSDFCDFDHFRREIDFVNYVRDRLDAQVHVLVTTRDSGGGGTEFTLHYLGRGEFEARGDSLTFFTPETDTFDEVRSGLTRRLALGLGGYAARLPTASRLQVRLETSDTAPGTQAGQDQWDFWVFRIQVGGLIAGEERERSVSGEGSLSANRTTEGWKIDLWANSTYGEDRFEFDDGSRLTSITRELDIGGIVVRSLGEHWSVGGLAVIEASTFENLDLGTVIGPALEYSVFPYRESTRRALTIVYAALFRSFDYEEETIFDKTSEVRLAHSVGASYSLKQPWGSSSVSFEGEAFWDQPGRHSLELGGSLDFRIFRGFELNLDGTAERLKNQIFLSKGGASQEEILLRRRELGTDYRYRLTVGFSYRFGSIYNNIVNPRFG